MLQPEEIGRLRRAQHGRSLVSQLLSEGGQSAIDYRLLGIVSDVLWAVIGLFDGGQERSGRLKVVINCLGRRRSCEPGTLLKRYVLLGEVSSATPRWSVHRKL
jgi:hypothetical protein